MSTAATERPTQHDLAMMERWTTWVIRLTEHAAEVATEATVRARLEGALEDAESLRDQLAAAAIGRLDVQQVAIVRSVYDLWDDNHDRTEQLAALVDPSGYSAWRVRSMGARPDRHLPVVGPLLSEAAV
jgi:hypothetical protein